MQRPKFDPWVRKIPWSRKWQLTPVFLPGEFHEQRSLADYSAWSLKELDTAEELNFHFHFDRREYGQQMDPKESQYD